MVLQNILSCFEATPLQLRRVAFWIFIIKNYWNRICWSLVSVDDVVLTNFHAGWPWSTCCCMDYSMYYGRPVPYFILLKILILIYPYKKVNAVKSQWNSGMTFKIIFRHIRYVCINVLIQRLSHECLSSANTIQTSDFVWNFKHQITKFLLLYVEIFSAGHHFLFYNPDKLLVGNAKQWHNLLLYFED